MDFQQLSKKIVECHMPCKTISLPGYLYPENAKRVEVFFVGIAPSYKIKFSNKIVPAWNPDWNYRNKILNEIFKKYFDSYYLTNLIKCYFDNNIIHGDELHKRWTHCRNFWILELAILKPRVVVVWGRQAQELLKVRTIKRDITGIIYVPALHPAYFQRKSSLNEMKNYYEELCQKIVEMIKK